MLKVKEVIALEIVKFAYKVSNDMIHQKYKKKFWKIQKTYNTNKRRYIRTFQHIKNKIVSLQFLKINGYKLPIILKH